MKARLLLLVLLLLLFASDALAADRRTPVVEAVAKARDAVVNIRTEQIIQRHGNPFFGFGDSIFEQFFNELMPPQNYTTQSLGSGVVIDPMGYILTNAHVVAKASKIFVALPENPRELEAKLIGMDNNIDLAVLKIAQEGPYSYLVPGRSDDLLLGESVIAIGNPLGLGHSITTGIISSTKRRIQLERNFSSLLIQTDALINPGNSGGPLININGELIGINTAIAQQAQGIGFSIPIDTAKRVLDDLIEYGKVRRAFLGIVPAEVSRTFARSRGEGGILIDDLLPGSPAQQAGLQVADVVLAVDGVPIASIEEYFSLLQTYTPDDSLRISLLRGTQERAVVLQLTRLPKGYELSYTLRTFGFSLRDGRRGLVIERVEQGSPADRAGLLRGDIVAGVDGVRVDSLSAYETVLGERIGRLPLTFHVKRDEYIYRIQLPDGQKG